MYKYVLSTLIIILFLGCSKIYHKSGLSLLQQPFTPDFITFKTDGYYYAEISRQQYEFDIPNDGKSSNLFLAKGITPIIFYEDGFVKKDEGFLLENKPSDSAHKKKIIDSILVAYENSDQTSKYKRKSKANLWNWGVYRQNNSNLQLQYYINHFGQYRLVTLKILVLNDSTLLATHKYSRYAGVQPHIINDSLKEFYKFRKFSSKPDSINYLRDNLHRFKKK